VMCRSEDVGNREVAIETLKDLLEAIGQEARPFITDIYEICMGVCVCVCVCVCVGTRLHLLFCMTGVKPCASICSNSAVSTSSWS
jgi:hypothetical protein